jgi:hypothetical protein
VLGAASILMFSAVCTTVAVAGPFEEARLHYSRAEAAMASGRYADALAEYEAAYDWSGDPTLYYWFGVAFEKMGNCRRARIAYEGYKEVLRAQERGIEKMGAGEAKTNMLLGIAKQRALVEEGLGRVAVCTSGTKAQPATATHLASAEAELVGPSLQPGSSSSSRELGWALAGSAAVLGTTAAVTLVAASSSTDDEIRSRDRRIGLSSVGLAVVCGAASAVIFRDSGNSDTRHTVVSPLLSQQAVGVGVQVRF